MSKDTNIKIRVSKEVKKKIKALAEKKQTTITNLLLSTGVN